MDEEKQFYALYREVEEGREIRVTWVVYPAELNPEGREVWHSDPARDQGVFEGIENSMLFIRRSDGTLQNYLLNTIRNVEVLS
ncbi:MAG: hypothetical protein JOZ57_09695 [Abitibacteriaceae bacterium]|nr:hypothetical protein [Abditibacteriaceae bacterium]